MSEMVERLARIHCRQLRMNPDMLVKDGTPLWQQYCPDAREMIAAMREPTEAMNTAASKPVWKFSPDYAVIDADPKALHEDSAEHVGKEVWQAMIDEALK